MRSGSEWYAHGLRTHEADCGHGLRFPLRRPKLPCVNDEQQARYSRHSLLPGIGEPGQQRLLRSRVLVIGLGGLGSPAAMYLASSGVGELVLSDYDYVELSNLQRQIIHTSADVGRDKVESARDTIARLNPEVSVEALAHALDDEDLEEEVERADVVVDACDNFETRFQLNEVCWRTATPLVSGAAVRLEGQVSVFDPRDPESPCFHCLYGDVDAAEGEPCSRIGVLAPLLGIIGSIQAAETLKILADFGTRMTGRLMLVDALTMETHVVRLPKNPDCPICSTGLREVARRAAG